MKLRLHDGSLRLRLSQSEVARLHDTGKVEEVVVFEPGHELVYAIETGALHDATASFENSSIRVTLPTRTAMQWIESDQTGIEAATGTLRLLIEKDFQCLHRAPQPGEDSFPNPMA
jgi:hypothetical protein